MFLSYISPESVRFMIRSQSVVLCSFVVPTVDSMRGSRARREGKGAPQMEEWIEDRWKRGQRGRGRE